MGQREKLNCIEASANPLGSFGVNTVLQSCLERLCLFVPASLLIDASCPGKGMTLSSFLQQSGSLQLRLTLEELTAGGWPPPLPVDG